MGEIVDAISKYREPEHDTIYCDETTANQIIGETSIGNAGRGMWMDRNDMKILGLKIETIEQLDRIIICQHGDVFPRASDWKDA